LIEEHLGPLRDQLGISHEQLMELGREFGRNDLERWAQALHALRD